MSEICLGFKWEELIVIGEQPEYSGEIANYLDNYKKHAIAQGKQNQPPSGAQAPDQYEIELKAAATKFAHHERGRFATRLSLIQSETAAVKNELDRDVAKCIELLNSSDTYHVAVQDLVAKKDSLVKAKATELRRLASLNGFKAEHGLTRDARYPKDHVAHLSVISIVIVIEMLVNAFFYKNESGLLGGSMVALAVSVVNIGSAGMFGYFFRYKNHKDKSSVILGWAALAFFVLVTVYLNAVFSTFRTEYQNLVNPSDAAETGRAFTKALASAVTIFSLNIPFSDFLSFVLFFIGFLLGVLAFYKGYTFDDAYPGYGEVDRHYREAEREFTELTEKARHELQEKLGGRRAALQSLQGAITHVIGRISTAETNLVSIKRLHESTLASIQRDYRLVLETYRMVNKSIRTTPIPDYFTDYPDVSEISDQSAQLASQELAKTKASAVDTQSTYRDRLSMEIQNVTEQIAKALGEVFSEYLARVAIDAQQKVDTDSMVRRPSAA